MKFTTIMVGSTIVKLYNIIMEQKISAWVKGKKQHALGQANQRLTKHSTIDHLVTVQVIMDGS